MRKWIAPSIVVAAVIVTAFVYPKLPATMPVHWNLSGEVDGWASRAWGAWLVPFMLVVFWAMLRWLPLIDPRGANYAKFSGAFEGMIVLIMLFIFGMQMVVLAAAMGKPISMERIAPAGLGLLFIGIGNLLPRARSNWFIGIRTPWTLSSDRVWERTHRLGGYLFVLSGTLTIATAIISPSWALRVLFTTMIGSAIALLLYSYVAWRQDTRAGGSDATAPPAPTE